MPEQNDQVQKQQDQERHFCFLSEAMTGLDMTIRDDQFEFPWLLDAVRSCRKKGGRFRLIDSGTMDSLQLEWLLKAGADLYTSDITARSGEELERFALACQKGKAILSHHHQGSLRSEDDQGDPGLLEPVNLGRNGIYIHLSDKETERNMAELDEVAYSCRQGGSRLVYYHHGSLMMEMERLAENGTWIHILSDQIQEEEHVLLVKNIGALARTRGANVVVHSEEAAELNILEDLIRANLVLIMKRQQFDFKSPFKSLEKTLSRMKLDSRAFYLYPEVMI
jgi:hypothetical protein